MSELVVGAALKWAPLRVEVDPLTGVPTDDGLSYGVSAADRAALEVALRLAEGLGGTVRAATVGPLPAAAALREALAAGAAEATHVLVEERLLPGSPASCARTARGLAEAFRGCALVVCGDASPDGGTGAVPALLAARTGAAQALGLVAVSAGDGSAVEAERRLERGVRERIRVTAPAVLSVEASAARLRRAPLTALLDAPTLPVAEIHLAARADEPSPHASFVPYRPRTRVARGPDPALPPEARIRAILGIGEERDPPRVVRAEAAQAAREIVEQLRRWGYA